MISHGKPLAGKGIVVTRPAHQAQRLASFISDAGGNAILFPTIEIREVENPEPLLALIDRLDAFDVAIFVSPNAVEKAMSAITAQRALPPKLAVVAVGPGSGRELARFGVAGAVVPAGRADSEGLLDLELLARVEGRRVVVFRGDGGRELLGDTLAARGATVEYAVCYRRIRPELAPSRLLDAWAREELDAITVTSSEGLSNLWEMVSKPGEPLLASTPLFVPHPRIGRGARERGISTVVVTEAGDEGLLAGLITYFRA